MIVRIKELILKSDFITLLALGIYRKYLNSKSDLIIGKNGIVSFSSVLGGNNVIGKKSKLMASVLGFGSYIAESSELQNTSIGKFCSIGPNIKCVFGNHPTRTFVSTHPAFFSTRKQAGFTFVNKNLFAEYAETIGNYAITIGNDVWIGANVTILDGVSIGDGAVIAANALVNKDVAPYSIVGGVPAKHIKHRFTEKQIAFLLQFKWWDKEMKWITENAESFTNIDIFIKHFQNA